MTQSERLIASRLLERASQAFSRNGCNDMDEDILAGVPEGEQEELALKVSQWNSMDESERMAFRQIPDFLWMAYLASLLGRGD